MGLCRQERYKIRVGDSLTGLRTASTKRRRALHPVALFCLWSRAAEGTGSEYQLWCCLAFNQPGLGAALHQQSGQAVVLVCIQVAWDRALSVGLLKVSSMNCWGSFNFPLLELSLDCPKRPCHRSVYRSPCPPGLSPSKVAKLVPSGDSGGENGL